MSFDIVLIRYKAGKESPVDKARVSEIVRKYYSGIPEINDYYLIDFTDGSSVALIAKGLESSEELFVCSFALRNFSPMVITFIYDMAIAGDMSIVNAQGEDTLENPLEILVSESQIQEVPNDFVKNRVLCQSPEHLAQLLGIGFIQWADFRERILGSNVEQTS
jgi:hypothetical protein